MESSGQSNCQKFKCVFLELHMYLLDYDKKREYEACRMIGVKR